MLNVTYLFKTFLGTMKKCQYVQLIKVCTTHFILFIMEIKNNYNASRFKLSYLLTFLASEQLKDCIIIILKVWNILHKIIILMKLSITLQFKQFLFEHVFVILRITTICILLDGNNKYSSGGKYVQFRNWFLIYKFKI